MIKPKKLEKGDKVAIVSLSSGILGESFCAHTLKKGIERLKEIGLIPVFMENTLKGVTFIKNNPDKRAQDLKQAYYDDEIKGIICAIGGDDTYRLLPYLIEDEKFIAYVRKNPKFFTGFSDTTNNHFFFYHLGVTSYYGFNFINDLAELDMELLPYSKKSIKSIFLDKPETTIMPSDTWYEERKDFSENQLDIPRVSHIETRNYEVLRGANTVCGALIGGCLESIYDMFTGNRYKEQKNMYEKYHILDKNLWEEKILFLETSEEKPDKDMYRKMIKELKNRNVFNKLRAIIIGKPQDEVYYSEYKTILLEETEEFMTPILYNLNFGHAYPRTIIPYGLKAEINFSEKTFVIKEKLFSN